MPICTKPDTFLGLWIKLNSLHWKPIQEISKSALSSSETCKKARICDVINVENSYTSKVNISRDTWATIEIFCRNAVEDLNYRITGEKETLNFGLNSPLKESVVYPFVNYEMKKGSFIVSDINCVDTINVEHYAGVYFWAGEWRNSSELHVKIAVFRQVSWQLRRSWWSQQLINSLHLFEISKIILSWANKN